MQKALIISVRFLDCRYHGANDWPPSPLRLFQSILSGTSRGYKKLPEEAEQALLWLEGLEPPIIGAPTVIQGNKFSTYVPNNDLDAEIENEKHRSLDDARAAIRRASKEFHPLIFEQDGSIDYCWHFDDSKDLALAKTICALADEVYQLGRGIDFAWAQGTILDSNDASNALAQERGKELHIPMDSSTSARSSLLCPVPNTLSSLKKRFKEFNDRLVHNKQGQVDFLQPRKPLARLVSYHAAPTILLYHIIDIENARITPQSLATAPELVTRIRDAVADRLNKALPDDRARDIGLYVVGKHLDGADEIRAGNADKERRIKIIPLPSTGHEHADTMIRRLAVIVPQSCPISHEDLDWAFASVELQEGSAKVNLMRVPEDEKMWNRYASSSKHWTSVTPIALSNKFIRNKARAGENRSRQEALMSKGIQNALLHSGVDAHVSELRLSKIPSDRNGERAEAFADCCRFSPRSLWHCSITFDKAVTGPLIIGNGRFLGLGLMRPDYSRNVDVVAFEILDGLTEQATPEAVAVAARKAMMAIYRNFQGNPKLPRYVSGHYRDGRPAGKGTHEHVAVAADLGRKRLCFIAPYLLGRDGIFDERRLKFIRNDQKKLAQALEGLTVLRAGSAGKLTLAPVMVGPDEALLASSTVWESVTPYQLTSHDKSLDDNEAVFKDLAMELSRRKWPSLSPDQVEILEMMPSRDSGISCRMRLHFATAQRGPLLIGRTCHKGGGLFAGVS